MKENRYRRTAKNYEKNSSQIRWEDLDHKKVFIALGILVAILVLIITLIVKAVSGNGEAAPQEEVSKTEETQQAQETPAEEAEEENLLEINAYEEVNTLITNYYNGISNGDMELVAQCVDVLSEEDRLTIAKKKDYIESYQDVICYTKKGLEDNAYLVLASYNMKFYNIATPAPGIQPWYVYEDESGSLRIFYGEASEELQNYVRELEKDEEVAAVIADVNNRYQQLIAEDEDLGKFVEVLLKSQETEDETDVPEASQDAETDTPEESQEADAEAPQEEVENVPEETPDTSDVTALNKTMQLKDAVRIRSDRSTDSEVLKNAYKSELVTAIESYSDGWSKVDYNGTVGYCKTEFLEDIRYE